MLRKEFAVEKRVRRAVVYYSGLGLSELWLNGSKVGDHVLSPGLTDYDRHVLYETFDVTRALAPGRNAIGLWLGNGRYHAPRAQRTPATSAIPKPFCNSISNTRTARTASVVTDASWKLTTERARFAPTTNTMAKNTMRGRRWPAGASAGFDDSAWQPAQVVDAPAGVLASQMAEPLRVIETRQAGEHAQARQRRLHFRYGAEHGGVVPAARRRAEGHRGHAAFRRDAAPDGSLYTANLRSARATDIYILKGERHGSLGAAFHLSRLSLCGGDRLPRRADARRALEGPRGARRHGARSPISPAPTSC